MPVYVYYRNLTELKLIANGIIGGQMNPTLLIGKHLSFLGFPNTPDYFKDLTLVQWAQPCDELMLIFQQPAGVEEDLSTA